MLPDIGLRTFCRHVSVIEDGTIAADIIARVGGGRSISAMKPHSSSGIRRDRQMDTDTCVQISMLCRTLYRGTTFQPVA